MVGKVIWIIGSVAIIYLLNYLGIPGYVAAVTMGLLGAYSLLRKNQNGVRREKLALTATLAVGVFVFFIASGHSYGAYFGAIAFLAVGFGLTRMYKTKPDWRLWFSEVAPTVIRFALLERVGGAASEIGGKFNVSGFEIPIRLVEAFVLLIPFCAVQSICQSHKYGQRQFAVPRMKGWKTLGKVTAIFALVLIWMNPLNTLVFDNIKNSIMDSLSDFGVGKNVIAAISDTNGTSLLKFQSNQSVTSETTALELLMQYDKQLGGEYAFAGSQKLPSGDTVYRFSQISNGIPIIGATRSLVVDAHNKPLYAVGETKVGVSNLSAPSGDIGGYQAQALFAGYLANGDQKINIGTVSKAWNYTSNNRQTAYSLAYSAPVSFASDSGGTTSCNIILDAVSGEVVDIIGLNADDYASGELADVFEKAREKGNFSDSEFAAIIQSAYGALSGTRLSAWLYRDVAEQECIKYYTNNGNEALGKSNAKAIVKAFEDGGVKGVNKDESVVFVDMRSNSAIVNGYVNYPYDVDEVIVTHSGTTTQQYTVKTAVPITLSVTKASGEPILTLPVFDEESFEIYPTGHDEQYVFTIHGGSDYQTKESAVSAPIIPGTLAVSSATMPWNNWLAGAANASYFLSVKQLDADLRIENGAAINKMLDKITTAYNGGNGSRFISLYRFDELSAMFHDNYYSEMVDTYGQGMADTIDNALNSHALGLYAQGALIYYRIYNATFAKLASEYSELSDLNKAVSNNPDKTFIAFVLLGLQGNPNNWETNFTPAMLNLDNSTLALNYRGSEVKGDKTFVGVNAVITKNGSVLVSDTITLVLQHFGDAPSTISYMDAGWLSGIANGVSRFLSSGDYLGLDLTGLQIPRANYFDIVAITTEPRLTGDFVYSGGTLESPGNFTAKYAFDDDYFSASSAKYNHDLSIMSLQLAMAAFGLHGVPFNNFISQDLAVLLNQLGVETEKANNVKELLNNIGFRDIRAFNYNRPPTQDSIACTIAHKPIFDENTELLAIAVRGGEYFAEWSGDFNLGSGDTHEGFQLATNDVLSYLNSYLADNASSLSNKRIKVWIVGYSRGSAVANLTGAYLDNETRAGSYNGYSIQHDDIYVYGFAVPNVSKIAQSSRENPLYNNIFNIVSPYDPVPYFPFSDWGFKKYGTVLTMPLAAPHSAEEEKMLERLGELKSTFDKKAYVIDDFRMHLGNTGEYRVWISETFKDVTWRNAALPVSREGIFDVGWENGFSNAKMVTMDAYIKDSLIPLLAKCFKSQEYYVAKIQANAILGAGMLKSGHTGDLAEVQGFMGAIAENIDNIATTIGIGGFGSYNDIIATLGPSDEHLARVLKGDFDVGAIPSVERGSVFYNPNDFDDDAKTLYKKNSKENRIKAATLAAKEAKQNAEAVNSGHYPERYLAWLQSISDSQLR